MAFKINIGEKSGKTFKLEAESPALKGKSLHDKVDGKDISADLDGYEFEICGASDKSGFMASEDVEGMGRKKVLLNYGKGMHKKPKGEKKKGSKPAGLRLRKTMRGKVISDEISQINLKVLKEGAKKLSEVFPEQNKSAEAEVQAKPEKSADAEAALSAEKSESEAKTLETSKEDKKEEKVSAEKSPEGDKVI